jgi:hypothetical protein
MQGQTKKNTTLGTTGGDFFLGWRSAPLSALATIPVTLLLCFGVYEPRSLNFFLLSILDLRMKVQ